MDALDVTAIAPIRPLRRAEYDQLVEAGAFDGERLELLEGVLVTMSPQGAGHSWVIAVLTRHLAATVNDRVEVRVQLPFAAGALSAPEPDLALVPRSDEWRHRHPDRAFLVVEVASTSQRTDRRKAAIYAAAGVEELWLVDLAKERVEVYTAPIDDRYGRMTTVGRGERLVPVALPECAIGVDALLP